MRVDRPHPPLRGDATTTKTGVTTQPHSPPCALPGTLDSRRCGNDEAYDARSVSRMPRQKDAPSAP